MVVVQLRLLLVPAALPLKLQLLVLLLVQLLVPVLVLLPLTTLLHLWPML